MEKRKLEVVLAGQANVGKSVIFNHLTGLHQHVGNWPGKTIEKAEGLLNYRGYDFHILDLPGIYSLTTYSIEELISREYIAAKKPDFVINVVDSTTLERNLIFTLQLLELGRPVVLALNMMDLAVKKGMDIETEKLEDILGVPVVSTIASRRKGLTDLLDKGIGLVGKKKPPRILKYGKEVEIRIGQLIERFKNTKFFYPKRWIAIKFLEKDKEIERIIKEKAPSVLNNIGKLRSELEIIHADDSSLIIAAERCNLVSQIVKETVSIREPKELSWKERLDNVISHRIFGYPVMIFILAAVFLAVFNFGNWLSSLLGGVFSVWKAGFEVSFSGSLFASIFWAAIESILALINIAFPYIIPFYFFLFLLEDLGYLARISFLLDELMHKIGIHGKACIPLMLGFGCNVPACLSCRIMETERERFITGLLTSLVPCSAVTVIVLGLVGRFVGMGWVFVLYLFSIFLILVIGKLASVILPGKATELIMDMPDLKRPDLKTILLQTWIRIKEFIYFASPLVVISGIVIEAGRYFGLLNLIADFLSPLTVQWLGLPKVFGILLIFGILRKELILVMLAALLGTSNFAQVLSPVQMITLSLVSMFYIPCVATIAALAKEFGWKKALSITFFEILFALGIGGVAYRFLLLVF